MQPVAEAYLYPHCCFKCHAIKGPFVDTEIDDHQDPRWQGNYVQIYLCIDCVMGMAVMLASEVGWRVLSPEAARQVDDAIAWANRTAEENESLRAQVEAFAALVRPLVEEPA